MEKNKRNYYAFTQSKHLQKYAKTNKNIQYDLSNLDELDDCEYSALLQSFLSFLTASNVPIIITGTCYLKLMYENSSYRFKKHIFDEINMSEVSLDDEDDYNHVGTMLIICDFELYKLFLQKMSDSCNYEIMSNVKEEMTYNKEHYEKLSWYQTYLAEFIELKRQITQDV